MATDGPVIRWNDPFQYSAADERLMFTPLLQAGGAGAFSARSGLRPGATGAVTVSGTTVTVQPTSGVIYDANHATDGPFLWALPASKAVSLGARPGSGQSRRDLIIARVYDPDLGLGSVRELKIERVAGTASPTPQEPALPAMSMRLASALVPATGNVTLTVSTARTVAAGGVLPVSTEAERDALPSPPVGMTVYVETLDSLCVWSGTAWRRYGYVSDTGWVNMPMDDTVYQNTGFAGPFQVRRLGDVVNFRGARQRRSGNLAANQEPGWIPSSMQDDFPTPAGQTSAFLCAGIGMSTVKTAFFPQSNGNSVLRISGVSGSTTSLYIDTMWWSVA